MKSSTKAKTTYSPKDFCETGLEVISTEAKALAGLRDRIDQHFAAACEYLLHCEGRIIVTGMGKSGHIAGKIAATFASTGNPAFYIHPGDAGHGDMGMITPSDIVVAISNSGKTQEILTLIPLLKRLNIPLITLTGNPDSQIAQAATINVDVSVEEEACPLDLAPTASTTAALAMGDALAISLMVAKGFSSQDFAMSHPGGSLGRRLLLRVTDIMHKKTEIPCVNEDTILSNALIEMTSKGLGMTTVVNKNGTLLGIYTDGDLRRSMDQDLDIHSTKISDIMTKNCKQIKSDLLAAEALQIMEEHKITTLVITDETSSPVGVIHMHDLLRAGIV